MNKAEKKPIPLRKAHWSEDPRLRAEAELQDGRHSLREALPDRVPRMTKDTAMELERAIVRCGIFSTLEQRFLMTVLEHTDGRTHVCYRHRNFLLREANISDRWARLLITRLHGPDWSKGEQGLILTRLVYNRKDVRLIRGTTEWMEGCQFLRWEVVTQKELDEGARKIKWAAFHSPPRAAVAIPPRAAVAIPPRAAVAIPPRAAVAIPPRAAVAIPPRAAVHSPPTGELHSPPSICASLKSLTDPSSSSSPQEAAATSGPDSRDVADATSRNAPPRSGAHLRAAAIDERELASNPGAIVPEREGCEGGRATFGPTSDATVARAVRSREDHEAAVAWFEFRRRTMFPEATQRTPVGVELDPYFAAVDYLLETGLSADRTTAAAHLEWVVWSSYKSHRDDAESVRLHRWTVRALLLPTVIVWGLGLARDRGKNVDRRPGERATAPPPSPARPGATSSLSVHQPVTLPDEETIAAMRRAKLPIPTEWAIPEQTASILGEKDGKRAAE